MFIELLLCLFDDVILMSDLGFCVNWYVCDLMMWCGMMGFLFGGFVLMGVVVLYVIVVKFVYLVCLVIVMVGDGVM